VLANRNDKDSLLTSLIVMALVATQQAKAQTNNTNTTKIDCSTALSKLGELQDQIVVSQHPTPADMRHNNHLMKEVTKITDTCVK
jgi:hypothetical protein